MASGGAGGVGGGDDRGASGQEGSDFLGECREASDCLEMEFRPWMLVGGGLRLWR